MRGSCKSCLITIWFSFFGLLNVVSEAPKTVPIARKYDSRRELEEVKTTEQQKEEVNVTNSLKWQLIYGDFLVSYKSPDILDDNALGWQIVKSE